MSESASLSRTNFSRALKTSSRIRDNSVALSPRARRHDTPPLLALYNTKVGQLRISRLGPVGRGASLGKSEILLSVYECRGF